MSELVLHFFPGTCARVALTALEQVEQPYSTRIVRLFRGEHRQPPYLAINPRGKVPTLVVDGRPLTENLAIVQFLARQFPSAGLIPLSDDAFGDALAWADLAWCASTLHPLITRLRMAQLFAGPDHAGTVWAMADEALAPNLLLLDARLREGSWMLGSTWSLVDAFVFWLWDTAIGADVDPSPYHALARHAERCRQHPAIGRALAAEGAAFAELAIEGAPPGLPPSAKPRS